jgi:alkanesulfonate monooxygenase SsuD/methylene tetrahydromethanopterin reductase-like flavin-dependent oxidoreductase (luciferase family)
MDIYCVLPEAVGEFETFRDSYRTRLTDMTRVAEESGWTGGLIPAFLHEVDPFMVASFLGAVTRDFIPLIAVQPACTPPHAAAACASAYAMIYDRPVYFNLVAGARDDEMRRVGDVLTHDERYDRMKEYADVLRALLRGEAVDYQGTYYRYRKFRLAPRPEVLERCKVFMAGSSDAGRRIAPQIADVVVTHPKPFPDLRDKVLSPLLAGGDGIGIRIGMICRESGAEAWELARSRFPETWLSHQETLLKTQSQSVWSRDLAQMAISAETGEATEPDGDGVYWLGAFRSGRTSAPFLVGAYDEVAAALRRFVDAGVSHIVLATAKLEDFAPITRCIQMAQGIAQAEPVTSGIG